MALLATQTITRDGITPSYAAAAGGGDTFTPGTNTFLVVKNGGGSSITATITTPRTDALGNAIADNAITVANGSEEWIGPFPYEHYADPTTGVASVAYSGVTTVTVAAISTS